MCAPRGVMCHCFSDFCYPTANIRGTAYYYWLVIHKFGLVPPVSPEKLIKICTTPASGRKEDSYYLSLIYFYCIKTRFWWEWTGKNIQCLMILSLENKHIKIEWHILYAFFIYSVDDALILACLTLVAMQLLYHMFRLFGIVQIFIAILTSDKKYTK